MTVLCQLNQCSQVGGLLLFLGFLFICFVFWQIVFCVVFVIVMQGHILRNVSLVTVPLREHWCASINEGSYDVPEGCHVTGTPSHTCSFIYWRLCHSWLFHYWINNFLTVSLCVEMSRKEKNKKTCIFIFNSHFNIHPKLAFKTCKIYILHNFC